MGAGRGAGCANNSGRAKKLHQPPLTSSSSLFFFFIPENFGFLPLNLEKRRNSGTVVRKRTELSVSALPVITRLPPLCFAHRPDSLSVTPP